MATIVKTSGSAEVVTTETGEIIEEILGPRDGSAINYSLAKVLLPPGKSSADHYHPVCEESYHFIAGEAVVHSLPVSASGEAKKVDKLKKGDTISILPNTWHQIFNHSEKEDCIFVVTCSPEWNPECSVFRKE